MSGPGVLLLTALLLLAATAATTALLRPEGRIDAAVTGGVVAMVLAASAVLIAGMVEGLRPLPLLALQTTQAVVSGVLLIRRDGLRTIYGWPSRPRWAFLRAAPWEAFLVGLAAIALGWQLLVALVLPPYAYDALSYHLTTVATWVQSGTLARSPLSLCCAYYPSNAELLSAWPVVLLGSDALVDTVQIFAAVLGGAAVAGIGRTAGLSAKGSAAAGALFVLTPAVLAQAPTAYVDVQLAALALAGLHGLARFAATARLSRLAVPGLCAGLLTGTKGTGPLWAMALLITAAVVAGIHVRHGRLPASAARWAITTVVGSCAVLGGWWYVRNAVDTGNPVYPFRVQVLGQTLFKGPFHMADILTQPAAGAGQPWPAAVVHSWVSDLLPWRHGTYSYEQRSGGLGPVWSWLGIPLSIPLAIRLWRQRHVALSALLPVVAVWLAQPYRWWARFTLPIAALGAIAVVLAVERWRHASGRWALRLAVAGLALLETALVIAKVDPASRSRPLPAAEVFHLVGTPARERTVGRIFLPEYQFLEHVPENATIVVDLGAEPVRFVYPLFGPRLRRTVRAAGQDPVPDSAWVVTARGRPLDDEIARRRSGPAFDVRSVRVWAPVP